MSADTDEHLAIRVNVHPVAVAVSLLHDSIAALKFRRIDPRNERELFKPQRWMIRHSDMRCLAIKDAGMPFASTLVSDIAECRSVMAVPGNVRGVAHETVQCDQTG